MKNKMMMVVLLGACLCSFVHAQKFWELKPGELGKMVAKANVVVEARLQKVNESLCLLKVINSFKGSKGANKSEILLKASDNDTSALSSNISYIFFLQEKSSAGSFEYKLIEHRNSILKSDIFLADRIRKEVMKWRAEKSDFIALLKVKEIREKRSTLSSGQSKVDIVALCDVEESFKGEKVREVLVHYSRYPEQKPSQIFLFRALRYVMFLQKVEDKPYFELASPYEDEDTYMEGTISLDLLKLATRIENRFDRLAGKVVDGVRANGRVVKRGGKHQIQSILSNTSESDLEIYHNRLSFSYFTLLHILDEKGQALPVKYPRKSSVPPIVSKHFIKLKSGGYVLMPKLNLTDYVQLKPGKYNVYIEFHLPWEYTGKTIGKQAWAGKVFSNKISLSIQ